MLDLDVLLHLPQQGHGMLPLQWSIAGADGCVEGDLKESCSTSCFGTSRYCAVVHRLMVADSHVLTCLNIQLLANLLINMLEDFPNYLLRCSRSNTLVAL